MFRPLKLGFLPVVFTLAACANSGANYQPVIDGPVGPNYSTDLAQCRQLAASQPTLDGSTAASVGTGAAAAGVGSVIFNDNSDNLGRAAGVGAVAGLTADLVQKNADREAIIKNCMRGRGYNVVG